MRLTTAGTVAQQPAVSQSWPYGGQRVGIPEASLRGRLPGATEGTSMLTRCLSNA